MHKNPRIIEGNPADTKFWGIKMNPQIVKTANSKPANSEGRLYIFFRTNFSVPQKCDSNRNEILISSAVFIKVVISFDVDVFVGRAMLLSYSAIAFAFFMKKKYYIPFYIPFCLQFFKL